MIGPRKAIVLAATLCACAGAQSDAANDPAVLTTPADSFYQAAPPDTFQILFTTSEGSFTVEVYRDWAPLGSQRLYNLVRAGYYDGNRFFRVIDGFMAQFGIHGEPAVNTAWENADIPDDPVTHTNERGTLVFATRGPNTRTTQLFINFGNNTQLDGMGFTPLGRVVEGMEVVDRLHAGYGEGAPRGGGPDQMRLRSEGNSYLESSYPELDYIETARIVTPGA